MKTATYTGLDGEKFSVDYDENAACICCGEPVVEASMGGTVICPWCDTGHCRYCGVAAPMIFKEELDGGRSLKGWREHMAWHRTQPEPQEKGEQR